MKLETIIEVVTVKQVVMERSSPYKTGMISSNYAGNFGIAEIGDEASEVMLVAVLNSQNEINAIYRTSVGTLNSTIAHPREIFRSAIMNNGASVMIFHNHPSGGIEPSEADKSFTNRIEKAGKLLGIDVIDHIIVTKDEFYSMRAEGFL